MFYDATMILVIPAFIFAMIAQLRVKSTFNKYARLVSSKGLTGAEVAQKLLEKAGIYDVKVERILGNLTDHYDPREKVLRLSDNVHNSTSLSAIGVAAHETGHAVQHSMGYTALAVRNAIFPVVNIGSNIAVPLFIAGMIISRLAETSGSLGFAIMQIGILMFTFVVAFQLVTLPVEINASNRALAMLSDSEILSGDEIGPAKKVLNAAAMTYVAAAAVAISQLVRLIILSGKRR